MNTVFRLDDRERVSWLQLSLSENVGPVTFRELVARYGSAQKALDVLPALAAKGGRKKPIRIYPRVQCEDYIARAASFGASLVAAGEQGYPPYLRHIYGAPAVLWVQGRKELATPNSVAIVGARNASALGMKFTRMIAATLVENGFCVVSGLARGIDTAAHQASLEHGTMAVVAGGLDYFYPPENAGLQKDIAERGLLISEMVPGTAPKAEHFPRRNRIISGASRAVIVIEAALRSGSLITARFAAEQGRDVFAVPGSPLDPRSEGTNRLIKEGAAILTSPRDVIEALEHVNQPHNQNFLEPVEPEYIQKPDPTGSNRDSVVSLLSPTETAVDDLIRESGLATETVLVILLELEIAGRVQRQPGGTFVLTG